MGDIDTAAVDSLKALDPEWPIREATEQRTQFYVGFVPKGDVTEVVNPIQTPPAGGRTLADLRAV